MTKKKRGAAKSASGGRKKHTREERAELRAAKSEKLREARRELSEQRNYAWNQSRAAMHEAVRREMLEELPPRLQPRSLVVAQHFVQVVLPLLGISVERVRQKKLTETQRKAIFVEMYREFGSIRAAGKFPDVRRADVREWKKSDPKFREAFDDAQEDALETAELEAWRRGVEGEDEVTITEAPDGVTTKSVRKYSDSLLNTLLKANPKYRDKVEHSTPAGKPFEINTPQESRSDVIKSLLGLVKPKADPK